jgi:hypothetical protein
MIEYCICEHGDVQALYTRRTSGPRLYLPFYSFPIHFIGQSPPATFSHSPLHILCTRPVSFSSSLFFLAFPKCSLRFRHGLCLPSHVVASFLARVLVVFLPALHLRCIAFSFPPPLLFQLVRGRKMTPRLFASSPRRLRYLSRRPGHQLNAWTPG